MVAWWFRISVRCSVRLKVLLMTKSFAFQENGPVSSFLLTGSLNEIFRWKGVSVLNGGGGSAHTLCQLPPIFTTTDMRPFAKIGNYTWQSFRQRYWIFARIFLPPTHFCLQMDWSKTRNLLPFSDIKVLCIFERIRFTPIRVSTRRLENKILSGIVWLGAVLCFNYSPISIEEKSATFLS